MFMQQIGLEADWGGLVTVRLLRRWVATREMDRPRLPDLVEFGDGLGVSPQVVIALASVFQLIEASLERHLEAECCCSSSIGRDERAVLLLLATMPPLATPSTSVTIPHGIPGALAWAVLSVRQLLKLDDHCTDFVVSRCPFQPK